MIEHLIHIRASGDLIDVVVMPPWIGADRLGLPSYRAAKRAADGLAIVHGWKIRDETPASLRGGA